MKVLVVVDMQNDFIDGTLGTPEAQEIVGKVVKKIEDFDGWQIYVTQDIHNSNYLETQEGSRLPIEHCIAGTYGHLLNDAISDALSKKDIEKLTFKKKTFGDTELGEHLTHYDIEEVVLIGLCTDICVISNAIILKSFLPEARIVVDASCCAGSTPEHHEIALAAMEACQIDIENWEK